MEHSCVDCKEDDPMVLEFDHLRDKKKNIGQMCLDGNSWKNIQEEIEKCEVVCKNCHAKRSAISQNHYKSKILNNPKYLKGWKDENSE